MKFKRPRSPVILKGDDPAVLLDRLLARFDFDPVTGCVEFVGCRSDGYGLLASQPGKAPYRVPRLAFELFNGPIPKGKIVRHTCDNPPCWAREHLVPGSHGQNLRDQYARGRRARPTVGLDEVPF
jgi:hypothetical protein